MYIYPLPKSPYHPHHCSNITYTKNSAISLYEHGFLNAAFVKRSEE